MKQHYEKIRVENKELEWLYVPDVEYGECGGVQRKLQLIIPYKRVWKGDEKYPLVMFIPGSAWHTQEMYNGIPIRAKLAQRGFAIAEVQYRESELAVFPAQVFDIKKAIRFIHTLAEQFHLDTDNIFIAGDSSGAHLALLTGLTAKHGELDISKGSSAIDIRGIISYSAPTDMMISKGDGPIEDLLGTDNVENAKELAEIASCKTHVSTEKDIPPILMFHGTEDKLVSVENGKRFFEYLKHNDKKVQYYELEAEGHGGAAFWGDEILDIVEKFIKRNCK